MKKFLLFLTCVLTLFGVARGADTNSADFSTMNNGKANTKYSTYTSTNGWTATNSHLVMINNTLAPTLNGKISEVGTLTSPALTGGIGTLSFQYQNTYSETNGVSVRIDIKQDNKVVKTQTLTNTSVTQSTAYSFTSNEFNLTGNFQIVITNLSPSKNTGNKDRVSIYDLTWTSYAGQNTLGEITTSDNGITEGSTIIITEGTELTFTAENATNMKLEMGSQTLASSKSSSLKWTPAVGEYKNITLTATNGTANKTLTFSVTVTANSGGGDSSTSIPGIDSVFNLITSSNDFVEDGFYVLAYSYNDAYYSMGETSSGNISSVSATIKNNKLIAVKGTLILQAKKVDKNWVWNIVNPGFENKAVGGSTTTNTSITNNTADLAKTSLEFRTDGTVKIEFVNSGTNLRSLLGYQGKDFRAYTNSNYGNGVWPNLYKYEPTSTNPNLLPANLEFNSTEVTYTIGEDFKAPILTKDTDAEVSYSSSDPLIVTIDSSTGEVTPIATSGEVTITASTKETDKYEAGSASYILTLVTSGGTTGTGNVFVKVTNVSQLSDKSQIIIVNETANMGLGTGSTGNNRKGYEVEINNSEIIPSGSIEIITLEKNGEKYALKVPDGYLYAAGGNNNNYLKTNNPNTLGVTYFATISISDGNAIITFGGDGTRNTIRYNNNSGDNGNLFSCYTNTSMQNVQVYVKATPTLPKAVLASIEAVEIERGATAAVPVITETETNTTLTIDETSINILKGVEPSNGIIIEEGVIIAKELGKYTVNFTTLENDTYAATTDSFNVTVILPAKEIGLYFEPAEGEYDIAKADEFTAPVLKTVREGVDLTNVEFEVKDATGAETTNITVSNENGQLKVIVGPEVKRDDVYTITAKFPETETYEATTAEYTLTVIDSDYVEPGTEERPYTVAEFLSLIEASEENIEDIWVEGYIVGYTYNNTINNATFNAENPQKVTVLLAEKPDETEKGNCIVIQLPEGKIRDGLNLYDNPNNLGRKAAIFGTGNKKYNNAYGINPTKDYRLRGERFPVELAFENSNYSTTQNSSFVLPEIIISEVGAKELVVYSVIGNSDIAQTADEGHSVVFNTKTIGSVVIMAYLKSNEIYEGNRTSFTFTVVDPNAPTEYTFDFVNNDYLMSRATGSNDSYNENNAVLANESGIIIINHKDQSSTTGTRLYSDGLRFYTGSPAPYIEITSEDVLITGIEVVENAKYYAVESLGNGDWIVYSTAASSPQSSPIKTMKVTYTPLTKVNLDWRHAVSDEVVEGNMAQGTHKIGHEFTISSADDFEFDHSLVSFLVERYNPEEEIAAIELDDEEGAEEDNSLIQGVHYYINVNDENSAITIGFNQAGDYKVTPTIARTTGYALNDKTPMLVTIDPITVTVGNIEDNQSLESEREWNKEGKYTFNVLAYSSEAASDELAGIITVTVGHDGFNMVTTPSEEASGLPNWLWHQWQSIINDNDNVVDGFLTAEPTATVSGEEVTLSTTCSGLYTLNFTSTDPDVTFVNSSGENQGQEYSVNAPIYPCVTNQYSYSMETLWNPDSQTWTDSKEFENDGLSVNGFQMIQSEGTNEIEYACAAENENAPDPTDLDNALIIIPGVYMASIYYQFEGTASDAGTTPPEIGAGVKRKANVLDGYTLAMDYRLNLSSWTSGSPTLNLVVEKNGAQTPVNSIMLQLAKLDPTGVEGVEAEEGEAEYYTLQGLKVKNPKHGIYIKVVNGKATKVVM